jgi:hypothetical protein
MPRCGMPCVVGYPNLGLPCRKGSSLWPYRAAGDTVSLRRPSEVLASVKRCAGLTVRVVQWGTSTPSTPGSSRGCAAWSSPPPPWCTTAPMLQHAMLQRGAPCCNIARDLATFCAILQHSARSCICGLRLRASRCAACNVSRGARHGTTWRFASALRACMGYRAAGGYRAAWDTVPPWDTAPHGVSVDQCGAGARRGWRGIFRGAQAGVLRVAAG